MAEIFGRIADNDALNTNPPAGSMELSVHGSDWLFAVTGLYAVAFLFFFATSFWARCGERLFHYFFSVALLIGSLTYFAQASDLGYIVITEADSLARQVFWPKYVNWVISFPVTVVSLGILSGTPWATIVFTVCLTWTWILSYLASAVTTTTYKWGFFGFGTAAHLLLSFHTFTAITSARRLGIARDYILLTAWVNFIWLGYPIAFGLTDGANVIGITPEFIFFGGLDILLTPVLSFAFILMARRWDYNELNLPFTRYSQVQSFGHFPQKNMTPADATTDEEAHHGLAQ
ncbi:heat shock protein 30 [Xylariaceae sp. FL0255]|nr:heat shock protein 30 [Xylariaceae sp. FL0255]